VALLALAAAASAQSNFIGFSYNNQITATSRFSVGSVAGEVMTVVKGEEYAGWGTDVPGSRTITSVYMIIQDQDAVATPEVFDVILYPESLATPGTPDLNAGVTFATGVTGPAAPTTGIIAAAAKIITPATPVSVPIVGSGDVFISFRLPATPVAFPTDGLSTNAIYGFAPGATFTVFDVPGPNQQPQVPITVNNTHCFSRVGTNPTVIINQCRSHIIDVAHNGTGGVVLGITNQASLLGSANPPPAGYGPAPGTGDFMSGVAPDVVGFNPGRADDIAFDYFRGAAAANNLVLFFADVGAFGPEVPLGLIFPGSTGTVCMNSTFFQIGSAIADTTGEAYLVTTFPAAVRPLAAGLNVIQQALELDIASSAFRLSPCGRQQL
jgi:hypothetical protein